ncbi:D-alanine--D-alanine ligase, partial [Klebsiella oxytoca]
LHGKNGEDGTIQGLLALAGIPCVGCGVLASACCMDKVVTHVLLDAAGIPQAQWMWTTEHEYRRAPETSLAQIRQRLGFPCFV